MKKITLLDYGKNRTKKTKRWLGWLTFCMMFLVGLNNSAQAQLAINYSFDVSNGTYSSISGTGTSIPTLVADNGSVNITDITPGFTVNGVTYTSARMNSNGWLALYSGTAPTTTTETTLLSTAVASAGGSTVVFAPLNVDLIQSEVATCAVYTETIGDEHIFEWANFSRHNFAVANRTDAFNFQLRLNHVTGEIKFVYGTMTIGAIPTQVPRVGWKTNGQTAANWATDINNLMLNVTGSPVNCNWNNVVTGNSNTSDMYLNATNSGVAPTSGLTYTWTPPIVAVDPVRTFAAITDITDNSAILGWTAPTGATEYNVRYRAVGSCSWTNFSGNPVNTISTTLIGLDSNTNYQIQVQASNGTNNSIWSHIPTGASGTGLNGYTATGTFQTALPACTGTPDAGTISGATVRPACGGSTPSPSTVTVTGQTTDSSQITFQWESSLDNTAWVDAAGTGNATITYTIPAHTAGEIEYYRLRVTCLVSGLSSYSDVLQITDYVAPDTQATNVSTSVLGNTTATVTWTNGNGNRRFVVINTTNNFTDPVDGSGAALTTAVAYAGSGEQIVYDGTGTSVTVTGLSPVTTYYVRVYEYRRCGSSAPYTSYYQTSTGTDNPGSFTTSLYCTPTTTNTSDYISVFSTVGGIQNVSYTATSQPTGSYSNQTAQIIQQAQGLSVDFSSTFVGGGWGLKIWVDVNNDGTFDDATEVVFYEASSALTKTGSVTIPVTLPTGDYRVRVRGQFGATTNPPACGNVSYGSTIDFTLQVLPAPDCMPVTTLTATGITYNQVVLGWTSEGSLFDIELLEAGTTPTGVPTNAGVSNPFTTLTNLIPSTDYEFYVRQDCEGIQSTWTGPFAFTTECLPPSILTTTTGEACGQGEIELSATTEEGANIAWYANETGGTKLGEGTTFTTPLITETTSYWISAQTGINEFGGKLSANITATASTSNNWGVRFTLTEKVNINSVNVYATTAGTIDIKITDGNGVELYATGNVSLTNTGTSTPNVIPLDFTADAGNYRMLIKSYSGTTIIRDDSGVNFPYTTEDGVLSVTSSEWGGTTTSYYYYFYNIGYSAGCSSTRTEVVATVTNAPDFLLSATSEEICNGETTDAVTITTGTTDYDTFVWEPSTGVSGDETTGWIFNPSETTNYTLTVSNSTTECSTMVDFEVIINALPIVNDISVSANQICEGTSVDIALDIPEATPYCLVTFPSNVEPITLVQFEGINNTTTATINGSPALEDFTAMVGNVTAGNTYSITVNGNTDGDFTGNFYVYIDWNQNGVFTDEGEVYSIGSITNNPGSGTPLTFNNISVPATALNGNTRMRVLKKFNASTNPGSCNTSGYGQAEDYTINVTGGMGPDTYSWSDGTSEVGTTSDLTVTPAVTTTYTITVTNSNGCTATDSVTITVNSVPEQPIVACYQTATLNSATCQWDITGEQPEEPVLACYETAVFNDTTCEWDVTGEQPEQPEEVVLACYETFTFNTTTCEWDVIGEQPEEPVLACYETATFNTTTCEWDVTGDQPEEPVLACYETATFNATTCEWDVTGDQPEEPVLACYETATFNATTCEWNVTGEQPEEPVLACYETATFNTTTCEWDVTGTAPTTPQAESPQTFTEGDMIADIIVTGVTGALTWYSDEDLQNEVEDTFVFTESSYTFYVTQTVDGCVSDATEVIVQVTLSTGKFDDALFRAYPNPVKDFYNISYSKEISNVSVVNMLGQTIIENIVNSTTAQIDMSTLPTGNYFVKVTSDGAVKTVKVIKQ